MAIVANGMRLIAPSGQVRPTIFCSKEKYASAQPSVLPSRRVTLGGGLACMPVDKLEWCSRIDGHLIEACVAFARIE
jgi:hypothetical protein